MRSLVALALLAAPALALAAPRGVPPELQPWSEWVLHGREAETCPQLPDGGVRCAWPSRLALSLDERGGRFEQSWTLRAREAVALPGEAERWPLDVRADGRPLAALGDGVTPVAWLEAGTHVITGTFEWSALPESLRIPPETGVVTLTLNGAEVRLPQRDAGGRLWLTARASEPSEADALSLAVHRLVTDDTPLQVTTRVLLEVSGSARELVLGPALPDGAIPVALDSPLPARLESDGRLRVQVRAGSWIVLVTSRQPGPVSSLAPPAAQPPWPPSEVWCFEARPELRVVSVEGVAAVDPNQTAIPPEWKQWPTFRVLPGETMQLVEKRRGDAEPAPDRLSLSRSLRLDFDGDGWSVRDQLGGELERSWRLEMGAPYELGRAAIGGEDQLLTTVTPGGRPGFEIRQGVVDVQADSRVETGARTLAACGWDADLDSLAVMLDLPPGWRLLHARGADSVAGSWVSRWTLLDLFLALVVAVAAARVWGRATGLLALGTLVLTIPEGGAPRWSWVVLLACAAVEKLLDEGRTARSLLLVARLTVATFIAIVSVPFVVQQARQALHPQLEVRGDAWWPAGPAMAGAADAVVHRGMPAPMPGMTQEAALSNVAPAKDEEQVQRRTMHDPRDIVQMGVGVPDWSWRRHDLGWSGPVARDQQVSLVLLPPTVVRLLSGATVLLVLALVLRALVPPDRPLRRPRLSVPPLAPPEGAAATMAGAILGATLLAGLLASPAARAEVPRGEILDELRARLIERAPCSPRCASIPRLHVEPAGDVLRLRLQVVAAAEGAVALPGSGSQWSPQRVVVDGGSADGLLRTPEGTLWLLVGEGSHDVEMSGALPARDLIGLPLPERPARVTLRADGWTVSGVTDGVPDATLQLSRSRREAEPRDGSLAASSLPPFVRVQREIELGLTWEATTMAYTLVPTGSPVVLEIPLLPGESVTTPGVRVENGHVQVNLAPGMPSLAWRSTLAEAPRIELRAPETTAWSEAWTLSASPRWHVAWSGVPPVHAATTSDVRQPSWRPWPGESVTLDVTRPEALPGTTLAVDSCTVALSPGKRVSAATLDAVLRSSRGGEHVILIPEGATAQSLTVNGLAQPLRQDGRSLALSVTPGTQQVSIAWREPRGMAVRHRSPDVDLGAPVVNVRTTMEVPGDRWLLWTSGPRIGPAVLFWSLLAVLLMLAAGLSRVRVVPLKPHDWVLLLVGLSQVPVAAGTTVVAWLLLLAWRKERVPRLHAAVFALAQIVVVFGALVSVGVLFAAINQGLLGQPDMQVQGNGSSGSFLAWYADRATGVLPPVEAVSVSIWWYRLLMLLWASWLGFALVRWMRWAWECFTTGGTWRAPYRRKVVTLPASPAAPPPPAAETP